ncbi:hypothetical protein BVRB_5g103900 [Beta vulgaris subsp. vulgaris]|uniref:uncharacterized protein LOC104892610 n=1 Tax=Beta vulgaris subsp. vulgaris TaxID=3555 RepID=UPI00053F2EF1|nr:uncharacterized protein LOC104892610 [Beta vulgaris subsp. vulgaris]KMT12461.1 hypothetical protein BVRB_5g103900 [Beta vulgaris subsp. vulgaris]
MIPLNLTLSPPSLSLSSPFLHPSSLPKLTHFHNYAPILLNQKQKKKLLQLRKRGICRAELQQEAPFAIAIGACMLNSLLFSDTSVSSSEDEDAEISSTDARFAIMTIISLIPYFNWLSWIFALMDTGKQRYAVYAIVYLAPYFRSNLSISPEESWLPIASIVLGVIHIQLEASIRSGDLDSFNLFNEAAKGLGLVKKHSGAEDLQELYKEGSRQENKKLLLGQQSKDEIIKWVIPRKPSQDLEQLDEDSGSDDGTHH